MPIIQDETRYPDGTEPCSNPGRNPSRARLGDATGGPKMTRNTYDWAAAERLVPLLRSISDEIIERMRHIETLEQRLEALASMRASPTFERENRMVRADLAIQRRELRLSVGELARSGCGLDADRPLLIRIPGADGRYDSGFEWDALGRTLAPSTLAHA